MDTPNTSTRLLAPRLVGRVWGGDRLRALAPDAAPSGPIGEAWFGDADEQPGGLDAAAEEGHQAVTPTSGETSSVPDSRV